ncbi:helix-turn-helix domain-containing protein [Streptomyces sp. NBC_00669]|uniref:helix-turn-helix domain-containing protein n=1 Tax=Streptomyces sp. NBC_00669 TaxID=2976011 RepID=UPI002E37239F|nr:helix-turn-helix domain-containing protein [Streptomyces sp. NBC_00669]
MAQADLAAAVRRTQGRVSKVGNERVERDRAGTIDELAAALHCHPKDLTARPHATRGAESGWRTSAASIERELRRYDLAPVFDGTPRRSPAGASARRRSPSTRSPARPPTTPPTLSAIPSWSPWPVSAPRALRPRPVTP